MEDGGKHALTLRRSSWALMVCALLALSVAPVNGDPGHRNERSERRCRRDAQCPDGQMCGTGGHCQRGCRIDGTFYEPGASKPGNPCRSCRPASSRGHWSNSPAGSSCDDGNACTTADTCRYGACVGGPRRICDDGNMCTVDTCEARSGCSNTQLPEGETCDLWVTDGPVIASTVSGNTLFVGGDFSWVGPASGGGVPIDARTGELRRSYPKVLGSVWTVIPDGGGGWYIGGRFSRVGDAPRRNLAHIRADGRVGAWDPQSDGDVFALARSGNLVYAAGGFQHVGAAPRTGLAAIDRATGLVNAWSPHPDSASALALLVHRGTLYVGGGFESIDGAVRPGAAAFSVATGELKDWVPALPSTVPVATAFAANGAVVFTAAYKKVYALDADTGQVVWGPVDVPGLSDLATSDGVLYVSGSFSRVAGQSRTFLAALDQATGALTPWNPSPGREVGPLAVGNGQVYTLFGAYDESTGAATAWDPQVRYFGTFGASFAAVAVSGNTVFLGGNIAGVASQGVSRRGLAAIDVTSGRPTAWSPAAPILGLPFALTSAGDTLYVGGSFTYYESVADPRTYLAAFDTNSAALSAWNPQVGGVVECLAASSDTLYVGGTFRQVGDQSRVGLAALDRTTGLPTAWQPQITPVANRQLFALALANDALYIGGQFSHVGSEPRAGLAALDLTSGAALPWNPAADLPFGLVLSLAPAGSSIFVSGDFTQIGGEPRSQLAELDAVSGLATAWDPSSNSSTWLAVHDDLVYTAGYFSEIGGQPRLGTAALDLLTGEALPWAPQVAYAYGPISFGPGRVFVGTGYSSCGSRLCAGLAAIRGPAN